MTVQFIVVTQSDDVFRYVGVKRTNIFPKDLRVGLPEIFAKFEVYSIKAASSAEAKKMIFEHASNGFDEVSGAVILLDDTFSDIVVELGRIFFVVKFDRNLGGMSVHNYFNRCLPPISKTFAYFASEFDNEKRRKMFLLPLRNFDADELQDLLKVFLQGVPMKGLPLSINQFYGKMRNRQKPKTIKTNDQSSYYVDDNDHFYSYGPEHHALPETKNPPHGDACAYTSRLRFGKRYDHGKHYNVSNEAGKIAGNFDDCHGTATPIKERKHINMFPNDYMT
ncbi:hypothetical protein M0412_12990 [Agrobacterium sp. O3.4]|uniref:Uncharacterized protein n=2 Tax=Rhizobium/Agrobacterium group TaxID=227290 RepID=A0A546XGE5_RHIRH|nr:MULTISPECIES: hypothetical protein [Rhizobium/Agrobacterium group]MCZ7468599.1 hypothetical protein [Rhizobium rhizogenes]TRA99824.1 hypothetical protein EXN68_15365 [Rhizobium rhizogenes]WHO10681.1 hypothetical protein KZ699_19495 [Agrobacterium cucumeris]